MPVTTELTELPATIPELLSKAVRNHGDQPAVVDEDSRLTYSQLDEIARTVARALLACGVRLGDRVALWVPNRSEYVVALLGAQLIGASVVPLNTRYRGSEARAILRRSRASALIVANEFLGTDYLAMLIDTGESVECGRIAGLTDLHTVIDLDGDHDAAMSWRDFLQLSARTDESALRAAVSAVTADTVADILYTSGTTGAPKGVMSAHRQTIRVAADWARGAQLSPTDRYAVVNPFFHSFGYKAGIVCSLLSGTAIYPVQVFEPVELLAMIERERITVLPGPPTIFTTLINHPRRSEFDTSALRFSIAGATTVPDVLFREMREILGFDTVAQAYGLTECPVVTLSRANEDLDHIAETTGPPVSGLEVRIAGSTGESLPPGEDGEILIRGESVMMGYFDDPEATAASIDPEGWLHTGDVGRVDQHGCVTLTGRIKDMFIVGGFNVYPAEVEQTLSTHPKIAEAAVVGVPDVRLGSVGHAFVVPVPGAEPEVVELQAFCSEHLANFKVPRGFTIGTELPRNATGKVLKDSLRARICDPVS
ncbi:AMP-binding protein [Gordonia sp. LSe1-13]|uniref:AMP-binding protein n=1 Tax=Gordonia sesuvii TaxID=3116777 RepID=A0ABU7MA15_9ACTN|nr:AMP-binding protein [Gordonia sp. LSe1-13]